MILSSKLIIQCLDSVLFLFLLIYIYLWTFDIRFSAVSYGTYSIEALVNMTFNYVKLLEASLWHFPYSTHCNLLPAFAFENKFCFIVYNRFVNFSCDCLSSSNLHIKFVSLLTAMLQMQVFGKNLFYILNMNLPTVSSLASVACELCLVKLGCFWCRRFHVWWVKHYVYWYLL